MTLSLKIMVEGKDVLTSSLVPTRNSVVSQKTWDNLFQFYFEI